ncbi:hypothetical protein JCM11251_004303 [Rhodosporidiobolus azoricus]
MSTSSLAAWAGPPSPSPPSRHPPYQQATYDTGEGLQAGPSTDSYDYQHMLPARQQRPQTPPGSVGIRRVPSFGSSMAPSSTHHIYPPGNFPPSPRSPTFRDLALQQEEGTADPAWFAASRDSWMKADEPNLPSLHQAPPPPFAALPPQHTPPARHKRNVSAEAAYATPSSHQRAQYAPQSGLTVTIPEYEAPSMTYSHTTPGPMRGSQQPTAEEVSKFFQEMTELLGEDTMSALSPTSPSIIYPSLSHSATPHRAASTSTSSTAPYPPSPSKKTYNVSGILLDEDEYRQYAASPSPHRQPSPAQYFVPPDETYQPPPPAPSSTYTTHLAPPPQQPYYGATYGYEMQRPHSAPPTPAIEAPPTFVSPPALPPPPPLQEPAPSASLRHRRGSSLDLSAVPRSIPSGLSVPSSYHAVASDPQQPRPPPSYTQQNLPPHSHFDYAQHAPSGYHTPSGRPSFSAYAPFIYPAHSSRAYQQPFSPSHTAANSSFPLTPTKKGHSRKRNGVAFINFSAADSKALLGGVAPSGSMKKRQREEEEAAAREKGRDAKRVAVEK